MTHRGNGTAWRELGVLSAVSLLLFLWSPFLILFLVPLQALAVRRGSGALVFGSAAVFFGILVARVIQGAALLQERMNPLLLGLDMLMPLAFLGGILLLNTGPLLRFRAPYRLLAAVLLAGICSLPLIAYFGREDMFLQYLVEQAEHVIAMLEESASTASVSEQVMAFRSLGPERIARLSLEVFLSTYLFGYFMVLSGNWWFGKRLGEAPAGARKGRSRLLRFRVPEPLLWALLLSWTGILATAFVEVPLLRYVTWNAGFIMLFLYGIQGYSIIQNLLVRFAVARGTRLLMGVLAIILIMTPGVNLVILVGVPILGVSETWIQYRINERSEKTS